MKMSLFTSVFLIYQLSNAQKIQTMTLDQIQNEMATPSNTIKVFNFWATWCGPCIRELPHLEKVNSMNDVEVILVSMDYPDARDKVENFIVKKDLSSKVVMLKIKDMDHFMESIDKSWTGAIPATLIVGTDGRRGFYEGAFHEKELRLELEKFKYF